MIQKMKIFFRLKNRMKWMFFKAYILCGYYRFVILFVPFNKLAKKMGAIGTETSSDFDETHLPYIRSVRRSVIYASKNTPWESLCMVQALAAQRMLNAKKIDSTIYFGLAKNEMNEPIAHAWLKHGGKIVVGEKGMNRFSVVAMFGSQH